jgi:hypothetical protein
VSGNGDELDEEHARLHRFTTPTSLDRTIGDDDSNELVDLLPDSNPGPEQTVMENVRETMVTDLLDVLDDRARYAVEQRFGLHDGRKRSYREVGEELGVTAEAARRLVKRAVNTVRDKRRRASTSTPPEITRSPAPEPTEHQNAGGATAVAPPPRFRLGTLRPGAETPLPGPGRPTRMDPVSTWSTRLVDTFPRSAAARMARPGGARARLKLIESYPRSCSPARPGPCATTWPKCAKDALPAPGR